MENNKLGLEPAFASLAIDKSIKVDAETTENYIGGNTGMSKRFYAACAAMQGLLSSYANPGASNPLINDNKDIIIKGCYEFADELLKQENE